MKSSDFVQCSFRFTLVILAYIAIDQLVPVLPFIGNKLNWIYLPTGIALAAVLRWGKFMLASVFFATFLLGLSAGLNFTGSLTQSLLHSFAVFLAYRILIKQKFSLDFSHRNDIIWFCIAAASTMLLSALSISLLFWQQNVTDAPSFSSLWAGATVSILLTAPVLISLSKSGLEQIFCRWKEISLFTVVFTFSHSLIFLSSQSSLHLTFIAMTIMIWAALRFNITAVCISAFFSSLFAAWTSVSGAFFSESPNENFFILWLYACTLTLVSLLINALQSERRLASSELQESFERINKLASRLPGLIIQMRIHQDGSSSIPYASDAIYSVLDCTLDELRKDLSRFWKRIQHDDLVKCQLLMRQAISQHVTCQCDFRLQLSDGKMRWLYADAVPEREADGGMLWHCFITNISERKKVEQDLRIAATTFESQEGIFVADSNWQILRLNQAYSRITGYTTDELIGKPFCRLSNKQQNQSFYENIDATLKKFKFWQGELWSKRKNGEIYPQMITLTAISDDMGEICNYIGSFTDISVHKGYEDEIRNLAFYDSLTQLPNRRLLMDRLQHLISISQRNNSHSAILFIDLDNFKTLNDTRGHDAGDLLLIEAANRLKSCVRDSDTVARLGGDEFVVILEELSSVQEEAISQVDKVGEKIRHMLNQPYYILDFVHHGSGSIGVSLFRGSDVTVKDLFKRADTAMYEAKTSGRNAVRFFDPAMQAVLVVRMMLESNLRVALTLEQFQLYYQIQVNSTGKLIGAEALLRWNHPDRGFISPADFIPLAEETGLIVPIGTWVLETACAQLQQWEQHEHTRHLSLAVNVSAKQFQQNDFVDGIQDIIRRYPFDPSRLKIELTESTILDNVDATTAKMHQLKKLGIAFSMDDFGTGYSSLAYLQKLPLNQLKIDQSFVRDINLDENDATIVRTIISLGTNLGLEVIAEGVETEGQRDFLIQHHCLVFQGYLYSKPLPISEFQLFIAQQAQLATLETLQQ